MNTEPRDVRLKRLRIRSWRRGIKEMDLILGGYADAELAGLDDEALDVFEAALGENDHDLFGWVTGQGTPPARYGPLMAELSRRAALAR
ncbi:MAG: succinate dehydrogenase assembly factor 2 [Pseudomonadota bacterium]